MNAEVIDLCSSDEETETPIFTKKRPLSDGLTLDKTKFCNKFQCHSRKEGEGTHVVSDDDELMILDPPPTSFRATENLPAVTTDDDFEEVP